MSAPRDTLVTAVYPLDPAAPLGGRARPLEYYLPSLASIARLGAAMVVYTAQAHVDRLARALLDLDVDGLVVGRELAEAPRHAEIQALRARLRYAEQPWRDRCHVLCHAKPAWLAEQAEHAFFGSSRFTWIDAGLVYPGLVPRRYLGDYHQDRCTLLAPAILDGLVAAGALVVCGLRPLSGARLHQIPLEAHLAWTGGRPLHTHVVGGLFGGSREAVTALAADADVVLVAMLAAGWLGTEENVLSVLVHRDPARATVLPFSTFHHEDSDVAPPGPGDVPFYTLLEGLARAS